MKSVTRIQTYIVSTAFVACLTLLHVKLKARISPSSPFSVSLSAALSMGVLGLAAFLPPFSAAAQSAQENFAEIQFSGDKPDAQFRGHLQGFEIFPEAFACGNADCVLEHVEFSSGRYFLRAEDPLPSDVVREVTLEGIHRVEYVHPVDVFVTTRDCVEDPNCPVSKYLFAGPVGLATSLSVTVIVIEEEESPTGVFLRSAPMWSDSSPVSGSTRCCFPVSPRAPMFRRRPSSRS